jgi:hypothetical protein
MVSCLNVVTVIVVLHRRGGWGMEVVKAVLLIVCGRGKVGKT